MSRILFFIALFCCLSLPALAGFEEGRAAYDRKDWETTVTELRPLAERGDDRAMVLIGNMYYFGYGVLQSYKEAASLYQRAAAKNNIDAMLALGAMNVSGKGGDINLHSAVQWFEAAAKHGSHSGAFFYALIMARGNKSKTDDIKPDFYNAYKWFRIAGSEGAPPKLQRSAQKFASGIAKKKLTVEQIAKADAEAAAWKPE
jgi:TPR repeat protein